MGYEGDKLVYKVYLDQESPITPDMVVPAPTGEETAPEMEEEAPTPSIEPELAPEL